MAETTMADAHQSSSMVAEEQLEQMEEEEEEGHVKGSSSQQGDGGLNQSAPAAPAAAPEAHGFTKTLVYAILACALGSSFQLGYNIGSTNVPENTIKGWINASYEHVHGIPINDTETMDTIWDLSNDLFAIGGVFGGAEIGTVADTFGRRNSMLLNNALAVIAAVLFYAAYHANVYYLYLLARFVSGLNSGLNSGLSPMYLVEIAPPNLRGLIGSIHQLFITISMLTAQVVGLPFLFGTDNKWPLIFVFTIVPAVFQLCALPFCPKSPKYSLIVKGNKDQAESHMKKNRRAVNDVCLQNDAEQIDKEAISACRSQAECDLKKLRGKNDVQSEMAQLDEEADACRAQLKMSDMFRGPLQWPLVLAVFMMLSQQFGGINAAIFNSRGIFENAGLNGIGPDLVTIGMSAEIVIMTFVSVLLMERLGRRTLYLIGIVGMLFSSAFISISMYLSKVFVGISFISYLSVAFVHLFVISFAIGPGSIPWFYVSEVFPSNARGKANSIAVTTNWAANTIVAVFFKPIAAFLHEFAFFIFTALLSLFLLFAYKFLPETKNKSLKEVKAEMDRRHGSASFGRLAFRRQTI